MKKILIILIFILIGAGIGHLFEKNWGKDADIQETPEENQTAGVVEEDVPSVAEELEGTWQSTQDQKFVREFRDDTVTDFYDNEVSGTPGTWALFTADNPLPTYDGPLEDGSTYLALVFNEETLFFEVTEITSTHLDLIYLDRGGILTFMRVPELE